MFHALPPVTGNADSLFTHCGIRVAPEGKGSVISSPFRCGVEASFRAPKTEAPKPFGGMGTSRLPNFRHDLSGARAHRTGRSRFRPIADTTFPEHHKRAARIIRPNHYAGAGNPGCRVKRPGDFGYPVLKDRRRLRFTYNGGAKTTVSLYVSTDNVGSLNY